MKLIAPYFRMINHFLSFYKTRKKLKWPLHHVIVFLLSLQQSKVTKIQSDIRDFDSIQKSLSLKKKITSTRLETKTVRQNDFHRVLGTFYVIK